MGDITPVCGVSDQEKYDLEAAAIQKLKQMLGGIVAATEIESLWREYEAGTTPEAAVVKDFDKVWPTRVDGFSMKDIGIFLSPFFSCAVGDDSSGS